MTQRQLAIAAPPRLPAWLPALLVVLATATLTASQTPDSVNYMRAAERLSQHGEFGADFLLWPPLYPALLAIWPSVTWAAILAVLGSAATVAGVWMMGRKLIESRAMLAVALLALVCSPGFSLVFGHAWSETVYVPLCVWLAYFWTDYLDTGARRSLAASCALLALAMLTRHVGVVLAIAMGLMAVQHRRSLLPVALACAPYGLWVLRTFLLSGTYGGERPAVAHPDALVQIESFGRVIGHWFVPHVYFQSGGVVIGAAFLLAAFAALVYLRRTPLLTFAALFVLGHCVLTVYTASRVYLDVDARTLFPVFWPTLLLVFFGLNAIRRPSRWYYYPAAAFALFWFSAANPITNALV